MSSDPSFNSADATRSRFDTHESSLRYTHALDGTAAHRRELAAIRRCLTAVPAGSFVLDLPCGTGRLLPFLSACGYRVYAADTSRHMLARAQERMAAEASEHSISFGLEDVFATSFADDSFDAVICNRLFHHFFEAETRILALRELRRISRGPVVVSFFCSRYAGYPVYLLRNRFRARPARDRVPISMQQMAADVTAAGFVIHRKVASKPVFGRQWYLELGADLSSQD